MNFQLAHETARQILLGTKMLVVGGRLSAAPHPRFWIMWRILWRNFANMGVSWPKVAWRAHTSTSRKAALLIALTLGNVICNRSAPKDATDLSTTGHPFWSRQCPRYILAGLLRSGPPVRYANYQLAAQLRPQEITSILVTDSGDKTK